jgi:hypothetical protein
MTSIKELRERLSKPRVRQEPEVDLDEWSSSPGESMFSRDTIGKLQEAFKDVATSARKAAESIYDTVDAISERLISSTSVIYRSIFPEKIPGDMIDGYFKIWIAMGFEIRRDVKKSLHEYIDVVIRDDGDVETVAGYKYIGREEWAVVHDAGLEAILRKKDAKAKGAPGVSVEAEGGLTREEVFASFKKSLEADSIKFPDKDEDRLREILSRKGDDHTKEIEDWYREMKGEIKDKFKPLDPKADAFKILVDDKELGTVKSIKTILSPDRRETEILVDFDTEDPDGDDEDE